ncbi:DUF6607 family protein [Polyangium aurulentum]|uniref:DUF6607 family protein n=1 Tax=Polyangium aurulentum TaxID=2567896 RepID=UPI0010ADC00D|nr:DUF6607 family protein [Polyangium aurulentum]UQA58832.1 hypothetical protein E8A73_047700 [Polyangium aurulentum]
MSYDPRRFAAAALLLMAGCASGPEGRATSPAPAAAPQASAPAACDRERDRAAIVRLAGEFWVDFHFEETVPLRAGYTPADAYETAARELVIVVEDSPTRVVLQHILVVEGGGKSLASKHWREDWQFEDDELLEFRGHRVWERRRLTQAKGTCQWSQAVFEVDDAPRYESVGVFRHDPGVSTWTSGVTYRPLPRREYTKRSDYDVLVGTNRITVTPEGWSHEQDNEKVQLTKPPQSLVREIGVNRYVRSPDASFAVASAYWQRTSGYWSMVREEWSRTLSGGRIEMKREVDGKPLHEHLFKLADATPGPQMRPQVREAIAAFLVAPPAAAD